MRIKGVALFRCRFFTVGYYSIAVAGQSKAWMSGLYHACMKDRGQRGLHRFTYGTISGAFVWWNTACFPTQRFVLYPPCMGKSLVQDLQHCLEAPGLQSYHSYLPGWYHQSVFACRDAATCRVHAVFWRSTLEFDRGSVRSHDSLLSVVNLLSVDNSLNSVTFNVNHASFDSWHNDPSIFRHSLFRHPLLHGLAHVSTIMNAW